MRSGEEWTAPAPAGDVYRCEFVNQKAMARKPVIRGARLTVEQSGAFRAKREDARLEDQAHFTHSMVSFRPTHSPPKEI